MLVCLLWHSKSLHQLSESLTLALIGKIGHYCLRFCPCSQRIAWARLPGQARSLAQSTPFQAKVSPGANPGRGGFSVPFRLSPTPCSPVSLLSFLTPPTDNQWNLYPGCLTSLPHLASLPQDSCLSVFPLEPHSQIRSLRKESRS